jgi:hypothetical protein
LFCATQEKIAQDNDESRRLWSFCAIQEKQIDDKFCNLSSSFATQGKKPQDDNELGSLLSSSLPKKKTHRMMMS